MDDKILITNPLLRGLMEFFEKLPDALSPEAYYKDAMGDLMEQTAYENACLVFNLRIKARPWAIVYCKTADDVKNTYELAVSNGLPIRIKAGGHDHEGESTGTNTILIDVSGMDWVKVDPKTKIASVGPGNIFKNLTTALAKEDVMIAHGTCATVGISGFIMGGGWGPWTRKYGMCCERLIGADMVLGDGSTTSVDVENGKVPDLLWALRGGGGMSYGLVTELRIQAFELPKTLIRFSLEWNPYVPEWGDYPVSEVPTIEVLKNWERVIQSKKTSRLIGTNLKVSGHPRSPFQGDRIEDYFHNCIMYGYWEGDKESLGKFLKKWFAAVPEYELYIWPEEGGTGSDEPYGKMLMSSWDRVSHIDLMLKRTSSEMSISYDEAQDLHKSEGRPFTPDYDAPAPHKITSRLVDSCGLGDKGYLSLFESLTHPLIMPGNRELGLYQYVTLGAIVGDYYRKNPHGANSAFPYKDKLYTIQYQTWWNSETYQLMMGQNNEVYDRTNRALDWMEVARDFEIANTSGAFISFKDASIPTKTYFGKSYDRLMSIKEAHSKDPLNHFRIRKSII